jgi:hypothetical protein
MIMMDKKYQGKMFTLQNKKESKRNQPIFFFLITKYKIKRL